MMKPINISIWPLHKDSYDYDTYYEWGKSLYKSEKYELALEKFRKSVELGK